MPMYNHKKKEKMLKKVLICALLTLSVSVHAVEKTPLIDQVNTAAKNNKLKDIPLLVQNSGTAELQAILENLAAAGVTSDAFKAVLNSERMQGAKGRAGMKSRINFSDVYARAFRLIPTLDSIPTEQDKNYMEICRSILPYFTKEELEEQFKKAASHGLWMLPAFLDLEKLPRMDKKFISEQAKLADSTGQMKAFNLIKGIVDAFKYDIDISPANEADKNRFQFLTDMKQYFTSDKNNDALLKSLLQTIKSGNIEASDVANELSNYDNASRKTQIYDDRLNYGRRLANLLFSPEITDAFFQSILDKDASGFMTDNMDIADNKVLWNISEAKIPENYNKLKALFKASVLENNPVKGFFKNSVLETPVGHVLGQDQAFMTAMFNAIWNREEPSWKQGDEKHPNEKHPIEIGSNEALKLQWFFDNYADKKLSLDVNNLPRGYGHHLIRFLFQNGLLAKLATDNELMSSLLVDIAHPQPRNKSDMEWVHADRKKIIQYIKAGILDAALSSPNRTTQAIDGMRQWSDDISRDFIKTLIERYKNNQLELNADGLRRIFPNPNAESKNMRFGSNKMRLLSHEPKLNGSRDAMNVIDTIVSGEKHAVEVLGDQKLGEWLLGHLYPGTNPANVGNVGNVIPANVQQNIDEGEQIETNTGANNQNGLDQEESKNRQ